MNQFLYDARRLLASTASLTSTLQRIARTAVPSVADYCLIFIANEDQVPCVASAHCTDTGRRLLRALHRAYKITRSDPSSTVAHVVRSGRSQLRSDIAVEPHEAPAAVDVLSLHHRLGTRSAIVVPIGARPNVLGAISMCYTDSGRRYTTKHLSDAQQLASMIAAFIRSRTSAHRASAHSLAFGHRPIRLRARV
jgi:GAF domain-containing protein